MVSAQHNVDVGHLSASFDISQMIPANLGFSSCHDTLASHGMQLMHTATNGPSRIFILNLEIWLKDLDKNTQQIPHSAADVPCGTVDLVDKLRVNGYFRDIFADSLHSCMQIHHNLH